MSLEYVLHNWCRNLNWIIIASLWTFRPLSFSHYFSCPLYPTPHDISLKTKYARPPLHYHAQHACITHTSANSDGCRQTINAISGYDWHMVLMNPLGSVSLCLLLRSWLTAVPSLSPSHTHTPWEQWLSPTSCCSPMSCGAVIPRVWDWCQIHSQMSVCVCVLEDPVQLCITVTTQCFSIQKKILLLYLFFISVVFSCQKRCRTHLWLQQHVGKKVSGKNAKSSVGLKPKLLKLIIFSSSGVLNSVQYLRGCLQSIWKGGSSVQLSIQRSLPLTVIV